MKEAGNVGEASCLSTRAGVSPVMVSVSEGRPSSFLTDASSEMIYPLLPSFLTATLGVGAAWVGIIEGTADATASLRLDPHQLHLLLWNGDPAQTHTAPLWRRVRAAGER